jgi:hypothetical protein
MDKVFTADPARISFARRRFPGSNVSGFTMQPRTARAAGRTAASMA